ncbi:MAG: alpha/beta hydrolase [Bacteroidia bacterium]|jgi:pimeloyl-ACP methyl ester carboxylesterase
MKRLFHYEHSVVSYLRFGRGKQIMVAFHGYGQSGEAYLYFEPVLAERFTVIAIDFFFHGESEWREGRDFTREDMRDIVFGIAAQEKLAAHKFTVCSFSMGARMARSLVQTFPARIDRFVLLSPPTFAFNKFLNFSTNTPLGLALFRYFIRHNDVLLSWVKRLHQAKILNRAVYLFSSKFMVNRERLQRVFDTWYAQRKLRTNYAEFARLLDQHQIEVILISGINDAITPPAAMVRYVKRLHKHRIFLVEQKHQLQTEAGLRIFEVLFGVEGKGE